ncbi:MAG: very large tegument protein [Labilithrix sp.]|nr:very large tegument protein [Labilithrix sp.]
MDCEKCEPLLLDELYDELDEVTSAALKRHVAGCARCAAILDGYRATRRAVATPMLDMLDLPAGLEDRILSSVKEAQKVVPVQGRAARLLSLAGSWAMRPQTAMAAVFLLMIGTSAFVIRARHGGPGSGEQSAAVSVTEKGEPAVEAPAGGAGDRDSLDNKAAAAAHGANVPTTLPPAATAANSLADEPRGQLAAKDKASEPRKKEQEEKSGRMASDPSEGEAVSNAGTVAGAPAAAGQGQAYGAAAQVAAPVTRGPDSFSAGMAAYRARSFAEATRLFDLAAQGGDQNAALWAANSVKDGNGGCAPAVPRYDAVSARGAGSYIGNEAALDAARCQMKLGQLDSARARLTKLASTASHGQQAQQALAELDQQSGAAVGKAAGTGGGGNARPAPAPKAPSTVGF